MKLIRFGEPNREAPGVILPDGRRIDASGFGADYDEAFFGSGGLERLGAWLERHGAGAPVVPPEVRLGPPVCRPSKIVCVGLNYRDHARESGMPIPEEPVLFFKATTAVSGPNDDVIIPKRSTKTDWEVELAVVIGRRATYVARDRAPQHVAGYGPFLATPDEIPDVNALRLWLKVNGEMKQCGSTRELIFDVPTLVSYVSQFMTLLPGDVISTGTPPGVGLGQNPPRYLVDGDEVELGIDGLGSSRQRLRGYR